MFGDVPNHCLCIREIAKSFMPVGTDFFFKLRRQVVKKGKKIFLLFPEHHRIGES